MQIDQTVTVVTGAASGLGRATVQRLAAQGARVVAIDLAGAPLDALAQSMPQVLALGGDVCSDVGMEAAFAQVRRALGTPRILVNCAGVLGPARVFRIDRATGKAVPRELDVFRRVIEVNLVGTFNTIRLFAEGLAGDDAADGEDRGVIVNTASVAAYEALSAQTAYGASKAGVASMTLPLARELARFGIRVMAIAPGTFETGMFEVVPMHTRRTLIDDVPFPPRPGRPEEFAHMVQALIENGMMNGSVVRIDGAVRMREPTAPREARPQP